MNLLFAAIAFVLSLLFALAGLTRVGVWLIERRNAPIGGFIDINGVQLHYFHHKAGANADLPTLVFIHGASANLKDQMLPLLPLLEGRAELLFMDRPGHGWSSRRSGNPRQWEQAKLIADLMERLDIKDAIIVAHSFGGSIATAFALQHPEKTRGLLFLSAATHPWQGGQTSWYYHLTTMPLVGWIFSETLALPAGLSRIAGATNCVFAPNATPENYVARASISLVLRPSVFRANAFDVQSLYPYALQTAGRYKEITAPTIVISGNRDTVVYEEIHSLGLARDIPGAELLWVDNLGHKPDWIASDLVVASIEQLAGKHVDLQRIARDIEKRIASDRNGAGICYNPDEPTAAASAR
jgi:pimeloyl-ACP methyl ester carboxylesterase